MPTYELSVILRQMARVFCVHFTPHNHITSKHRPLHPQPEVIATLKRTADKILDNGGIIRKLENLGTRPLPYKISEHGLVHRTGSYFVMQFDAPTTLIQTVHEEYGRDIDIVRRHIFKVDPPADVECTLGAEMLPPAYRTEVQRMVAIAKRSEKPKYNQKSGLDYYPFQK